MDSHIELIPDWTLAEYAVSHYEGTWRDTQDAFASGDSDLLDRMDEVDRHTALGLRNCATRIKRLVLNDPMPVNESVALLRDIADALDGLTDAVRANKIGELPHPETFKQRAEKLAANGGLDYHRESGRPPLAPISA